MRLLTVWTLALVATTSVQAISDRELVDCVFAQRGEAGVLSFDSVGSIFQEMTSKHSWKHKIKRLGFETPSDVWQRFVVDVNRGMTQDDAMDMMQFFVESAGRHADKMRSKGQQMWC